MITILYVVTCGVPVLVLALFILTTFKRIEHLKPTENLLGFLFIFSFFIIIPFIMYLAGIFHAGKGFIGYYLSLPSVLRQYHSEGKTVLYFFIFYLASIHILGLLPFLALLQFVSARNRLYKVASDIHIGFKGMDKNDIDELVSLIQAVKTKADIKEEVKIKVLESIKACKVIGSSNCAVVKARDSVDLILSRKFLELFSKGIISKDEVKAILFHEFGHIVNKDYLVPVASKVILNRRFILAMYFSFSILLTIMGRYPFLYGSKALLQSGFYSLPYPLLLILAFSASYAFIGIGLYFIALSLQRCEVLADNLAIQYASSKALKEAIIKMGIISEAGDSMALGFSSKSETVSGKRRHNFLWILSDILKTFNFFSKHNKLFYHPPIHQRIKALDNPGIIIGEEATGLLSFELFGIIGVFTMATMGIMLIFLHSFIRNVNWQDINWFVFSYTMYFWLVLLSCLPLRYSKNPFVFNKRNVKLIAVYSLFVAAFSDLVPLIMQWRFMLEKMDRSEGWLARMFIKTQISHSISRLIHGFIFSLVLFGVFLSIGNYIIRRKTNRSRQKPAF